jgi:hypothetical protein
MKAYRIFKRDHLSDIIMPGHLEDTLDDRLRSHVGRVRLVHRRNGRVIDIGPWRQPDEASVPFTHTIINEGHLEDRFPVRSLLRRVLSVRVIDVTKGEMAVEHAKTEIGTKYRFGVANGPEDPGTDGFDCSGLTQWAWEQEGVGIIHSAEGQRTSVPRVSIPRRGDLVCMWFPNSRGIPKGHASHVGLFYSPARFVHGVGRIPARMLDTRNPINEPVGIRDIELESVVSYHRPG